MDTLNALFTFGALLTIIGIGILIYYFLKDYENSYMPIAPQVDKDPLIALSCYAFSEIEDYYHFGFLFEDGNTEGEYWGKINKDKIEKINGKYYFRRSDIIRVSI